MLMKLLFDNYCPYHTMGVLHSKNNLNQSFGYCGYCDRPCVLRSCDSPLRLVSITDHLLMYILQSKFPLIG